MEINKIIGNGKLTCTRLYFLGGMYRARKPVEGRKSPTIFFSRKATLGNKEDGETRAVQEVQFRQYCRIQSC